MDANGVHYVGINIYPGGRIVIGNASLKSLICTAFDISGWQLSGGDDWTASIAWNVACLRERALRLARSAARSVYD